MKNLTLITIALFLFSCQETEIPPTPPPAAEYISWTEGDWWAYEWATYDYNTGDTTIRSIDTTYALADTMINGQLYKALSRSHLPGPIAPTFYRDSTGYIVNERGNILMSYTNFTDTLHTESIPNFSWFAMMVQDENPTTVHAGSFSTITMRIITESPVAQYPCGGNQIVSKNQYANGVGLVNVIYHYTATGPCVDNVRQLVDYHIQ